MRYIYLLTLCVVAHKPCAAMIRTGKLLKEIHTYTRYYGTRPQMNNTIQDFSDRIKPGETWRHYKNKDYRIITLACSSDNPEMKHVVYEALYDNKVSKIWLRPIEEFLGTVEHGGETVQRFTRIDNMDPRESKE